MHLDLCIHNSLMQEIFLSSIALYNEVLTQPIAVIDGYCIPPEGPGLGRGFEIGCACEIPAQGIYACRIRALCGVLSKVWRNATLYDSC